MEILEEPSERYHQATQLISNLLVSNQRHKICNELGIKARNYIGHARCTACDVSFSLKMIKGIRCPCCNKQLKIKNGL